MKAYIFCPKCSVIHGCVEILKGKEIISICYKCRFKPIRDCEKEEITAQVEQLCLNCLIDLAFNLKN